MHRPPSRRPTPRAGALPCVLAAALAGPLGAQASQIVHAPFDLVGWRALGHLDVEASPFAQGGVVGAIDASRDTVVAMENGPATLTLRFEPGQTVRRVVAAVGDGGYEVRLTVGEQGGARFSAGERVVEGGREATWSFLDVAVASLALEIEALDGDVVLLRSLSVVGRMEIRAITLAPIPETVPVGGGFPLRVIGLEELGGRPDLTAQAQLDVSPARALALGADGLVLTRVGGAIQIVPRLGPLSGPVGSVVAIPLARAPPPPELAPGHRTIAVRLFGTPPFELWRRAAGEKQARPIARVLRNWHVDDTVDPGAAYHYSYRRVDAFDNPTSEWSVETRARVSSVRPPGAIELPRVPVLVALFPDAIARERGAVVDSLGAATRFLYRHSRGRLFLDLTVIDVPGAPPTTAGPSMTGIERGVLALGMTPGEFGAVFAVADTLSGDYGGFTLLGGAGGAMARGTAVPTPPGAMGPAPDLAWSFSHEMLHVLSDVVARGSGAPPLASVHVPENYPALADARPRFDAGEAWDGLGHIVQRYDAWSLWQAPWVRPFETVDSDGDGLVDDDVRVPIDERRLGTDPSRRDTDGDGVSDLDELAVGLYAGSDPRALDTDGDGLRDGVDPWPLSDLSGVVPRGDEPLLLATLSPGRTRPPIGRLELAACWDPDALTLAVTTDTTCDVFVELDGSGRDGRFASDVTVAPDGRRVADVWAGPARLALRAHTPPTGVFVGGRRLDDATLRSERLADGYRIITRLPRVLGQGADDAWVPPDAPFTPGLRLNDGQVLGLAVVARPSRTQDERPFEPFWPDDAWVSLFEAHRLHDVVLTPAR